MKPKPSASHGDFMGMNRWLVMIIPLYNETRIGDWIETTNVEHRALPPFGGTGPYVCHKWHRRPAPGCEHTVFER